MKNKSIKFLPIFFVVIILVIAGWYIGIKILRNSSNQWGENQNRDILIYTLREGKKVTFYKSPLNKINPEVFYTFTNNKSEKFFLAWEEKDGAVFEVADLTSTGISKYYHLDFSGVQTVIMTPKIINQTPEGYPMNNLTRQSVSLDGKWRAKVISKDPESPSPDVRLLIQSAEKTIDIPIKQFPHSSILHSFFPQGFSYDNKFIFVKMEETPGDIGAIGLFKINIDDQNIIELIFDENKNKNYTPENVASSVYLQPSTEYAYYIHEKTITQVNTSTEEKQDIYSLIPKGYNLIFPADEKTIVFNPLFDSEKPIQIFDITTKSITMLPIISGEFRAISLDKKYLVYSKYREEPGSTPSSNIDHINAMERKIQITEYHLFDVENEKDTKIFTNKMVLSDKGNYVGLDGKEYSFVGLITQ